MPCSSDGANLRGHTANMVIMDEAAFISETVIAQVIFPMLATTGGTAIMLSTPWGRGHIFYRSFTNPKYWVQHVRSRDCPRITDEFLKEQRDLIGDLRFRIEYEAEFIEDQNALFTQDMIRQCVEIYGDKEMYTDEDLKKFTIKKHGKYYLGCDLGKRLDYSVIAIFKEETIELLNKEVDEKHPTKKIRAFRLVYLKQFELRTKLSVVADWIVALYDKFTIRQGCIDQTGLGEAVIEKIEDKVPNIEGVVLSAQKKQEVMMYLYTRMEQLKVALPFQRELISQMNEQKYYYGRAREQVYAEEKGVMLFDHPEGRHDDQLWAVAFGVFATRQGAGRGVVL